MSDRTYVVVPKTESGEAEIITSYTITSCDNVQNVGFLKTDHIGFMVMSNFTNNLFCSRQSFYVQVKQAYFQGRSDSDRILAVIGFYCSRHSEFTSFLRFHLFIISFHLCSTSPRARVCDFAWRVQHQLLLLFALTSDSSLLYMSSTAHITRVAIIQNIMKTFVLVCLQYSIEFHIDHERTSKTEQSLYRTG